MSESLIVMLSLPFALAGGVWLMWILGYNTSVAAQMGVIMLLYLDHAWKARTEVRRAEGLTPTLQDLRNAIEFGAVERLRPRMMTVAAVTLSLVPILWSQQTGSDVLKRIAAPMIGGVDHQRRTDADRAAGDLLAVAGTSVEDSLSAFLHRTAPLAR